MFRNYFGSVKVSGQMTFSNHQGVASSRVKDTWRHHGTKNCAVKNGGK